MPALTLPRPVLGAPQMAFVRAWAEGLDAQSAWLRYLAGDGATDPRQARAELQRLLDVLRSLARAHGRNDIAVLLRRDPEAMRESAAAGLSLDEFIARQPADFYTETELVALYQAEHGAADARSATRRRQRLRARLLDALHWLQRQAARAPQADDAVSAWLDERVAARLAAAGLHTLGGLRGQVLARGYHWHRQVPRLGPRGAARVLHWLRTQAPALGPLPAHLLMPPRSPGAQPPPPVRRLGLVPLERLALPDGLDGLAGANLGRQPLRSAGQPSDMAAVQAWLARWPAGSHTWRAYRREAERLLLWAVLARGKPLSALQPDDCAQYRDFLMAPGAAWCAPRHSARWSDAWRPFEAGLSAGSADTALAIVRALCAWLVRQGHWSSDPWRPASAPVPKVAQPASASASGLGSPPPLVAAVAGALAAAVDAQRAGPPALPTATAAAAAVAEAGVAAAVAAHGPVDWPSAAGPARRRGLSGAQWRRLQAWLAEQAPSPALHRLACALHLGAETGLRLSALCAARSDWLVQLPAASDGFGGSVWGLRVPLGHRAGQPLRQVQPDHQRGHQHHGEDRQQRQDERRRPRPVPAQPAAASVDIRLSHRLCLALGHHLVTRGGNPVATADSVRSGPRANTACDPLLAWAQAQPPRTLIGRLSDGGPLSPARLYTVLRAGFARCAGDGAPEELQALDARRERAGLAAGGSGFVAGGGAAEVAAEVAAGLSNGAGRGSGACMGAGARPSGGPAGCGSSGLNDLSRASPEWLRPLSIGVGAGGPA